MFSGILPSSRSLSCVKLVSGGIQPGNRIKYNIIKAGSLSKIYIPQCFQDLSLG